MFRFFIQGGEGLPHQVLIYDVIGFEYWEDSVTAKNILTSLAEIGDDDVIVRINCRGGTHEDGIAIYNALANHSGNVTVRIEGYACSMATVVACAGDKVEIYETALVMLHRASQCVCGNTHDMLNAAEELEKADNSIATAYSRKTGKKPEEMLALLDEKRDTWLSPEEAKALGMVDEVIVPQKFTALLDKGAVTALAEDEGAAILVDLKPPPTALTALEGVAGAVAYRVSPDKVEPIKAEAEPNPPPAEGQPGGGSPEGDPPAGGDSEEGTDGDETEEGAGDGGSEGDDSEAGSEGGDEPPPPTPPDPIKAERERVKAIRAQAKAAGIPADDDLVDQLIDDGVSVAMAGKMLLAVKRSTQNSTTIRNNHHSNQPTGDAEQVQASWDNAYKSIPGRR